MEPLSFSFCPHLQEMLETGQTTTLDGETIPLGGSTSSRNNLQVLRSLVVTLRPQRTLEVGLAHGASALTILSSLREVSKTEFFHVAIDPSQSTFWKGAALRSIAEIKLADHFQLLEEESCTALPNLYREATRFDLIYVDGSHLFEDAFLDFYFSARLLNVGGVILFDDCTDPHVRKVIRFIDANYGTILRRHPLEETLRKPLFKRVANSMGYRQLTAYSKRAEPPRTWNAPFGRF